MTEPRLTVAQVEYLAGMLHGHFLTIQQARTVMVPGSPEDGRADVAESATGWLLGWLQEQIRSRADEFAPLIAGDLDAGLRELLDGDGDQG